MRFSKVRKEAFINDLLGVYPNFDAKVAEYMYEDIKLPVRGTSGSAGYDICTPVGFILHPNEKKVIPTGIKAVFEPDEIGAWHLQMFVRSSIGIKKGVVLMNGTGIIDPDYQYSDNDGDMLLALWNTSDKPAMFVAGERICQGVLTIRGRTTDDTASAKRTGGVGSTGR